MSPIEVAPDEHPERDTGAAAPLFVDLQDQAAEGHGVVARDHAFFFDTQDLREIGPADGN